MKKLSIMAIMLGLTISMQSCRKGCYECTKTGYTEYLCEEDFNSYQKEQKAFNAAIQLYEADGYKCKKD